MAVKETSAAKIKNYIDTHLHEEMDLEKLAREAGYSKYHLERIFAKAYGCTINRYIREERLKEAAIMLTFTDASILEIALGACYESQQAFSLAFKRLYQMPPGIYRNNVKQAANGSLGSIVMRIGNERRMAA